MPVRTAKFVFSASSKRSICAPKNHTAGQGACVLERKSRAGASGNGSHE